MAAVILGLHGLTGSGKDTFVDILEEHFIVARYGFAYPLYEMLHTLLGEDFPGKRKENGSWTVDKNKVIEPYGTTLRVMLQTLGTEWGRELINPRIWNIKAANWLKSLDHEYYDYIVFTDVRAGKREFYKWIEADFISLNSGHIIEIINPNCKPLEHSSEEHMPETYIDAKIYNDGKDIKKYTEQVLTIANDVFPSY